MRVTMTSEDTPKKTPVMADNTDTMLAPEARSRLSRIDRYFSVTERGSSYFRELRGGLATFFAMAYIVVLNPLILSGPDGSGHTLGIPQVAAVTALVAGVMTLIMGIWARYPFALAAGLGVNAFVSATVATTKGLTWPDVMGLIVVAGVVMLILVLFGFREAVFKAVPSGLKTAIVVGIGSFDAFRMPPTRQFRWSSAKAARYSAGRHSSSLSGSF
jgi:AGZA family xanthine/uracil permease-like MFS transporter